MRKKTLVPSAIAAAILVLFYLSSFVVNERECVILTRFGKPTRTIERSGLYFKLPGFLEKVNRLDKRSSVFETQPIQLLLGDKNTLIIVTYITWKISEPLKYFQSIFNFDRARQKLGDMVNSQLGSVLGGYTLNNIINTDQSQIKIEEIESKILDNCNSRSREKYGVEFMAVGFRRINYPEIVANSVYRRMESERKMEADKHRAEGKLEAAKIRIQTDTETAKVLAEAKREAEVIKGEGDKTSMEIYAKAYSKNRELAAFLQSLEAYQKVLQEKSTVILSTDSEFFKYLHLRKN